ncbi:MAG: C25 family cysteine peptidase, partial [candidate division WOR-3 bacterium]
MSILFAQGPYTLTFDLSQFEFSVENGFDRVEGMEMSATTDTGAPELPVKTLNFILPNGTKVQNIEILSLTLIPVQGTYNIYPTQPPFPLTYPPEPPPWVPPDSLIYSTDALYPDSIPIQVSHRGSFDGIPMATIAVYPLLYNPVRDSLYLVQSITFRFLLENVPISQRPLIRGEGIHQLYLSGLRTSVYNQWEVDAFYSPPYQIVPDDEIGRLGYPEVIIVAPPACTLAYRPFANWLIEKGMFTAIVATDWIYLNYDGIWDPIPGYPGEYIGDDAAKIKEYLRKMYLECGTAFAILGGAPQFIYPQNYLPCRYSVAYYSGIPTDLYFQDFTGAWPNNPDYHEEIWIGRVPAWNYEQSSWWVEKRLTYEKSPANRNLMSHSLWITQNYQSPHPFPDIMEEIITYFPPNIIQHRVVGHPSNANDHRLIDTLSIGYGVVFTCGHGGTDGIRTAFPDYRQLIMGHPWYYNGVMPNLSETHNVGKYYIVYAINCDNAWFDNTEPPPQHSYDPTWTAGGPLPCMAEAWTSFYRLAGVPPDPYPPINAVAFLGNTRYGYAYWEPPYWGSPTLNKNFVNRLFYYDTLIGIAEAKARYSGPYGFYAWDLCYLHNLFGSPEMPVWTENPKDMIVEHPDAIPVNTPINFEVTVYEDPSGVQQIPLQNALVTIYKPGATLPEVYESEMTNADGIAYFSLNVPTTGVMKVTVTKHNYLPYQGDVQVFEFDVDIPTSHTQYTEGRKLIRQHNTENLHLSFTTLEFPGVNGPDAWSAYSLSTDGGSSWEQSQNVARFTYNPSIGLTTEPNPRPCLAFRNSYE